MVQSLNLSRAEDSDRSNEHTRTKRSVAGRTTLTRFQSKVQKITTFRFLIQNGRMNEEEQCEGEAEGKREERWG